MSHYVIRAESLGKMFRGAGRHPSRAIHDSIERLIRSVRRMDRERDRGTTEFWALRHATFEVKPGEAIGIVGANGAGKSVLLKMLARVTAPTEGRAEIYGRVVPLLEVGAGFHPELSGRDNIYLNGTILGMTRQQIRRKFDEIVAFAETESFIDTPVKLHSSGMRMRLAFSVATHLEPGILLVDEAFAIGDASFRAKCRQKIADFIRHGSSLILVSHDPGVVSDLCRRAILIEGGRMVADGAAGQILERYERTAEV